MKKEKLSLSSIKNVLSRAEMKKIMAGSGGCRTEGESCDDYFYICCSYLTCILGNSPYCANP
ncbi:MAG TPA: hypothetical protein VIM16_15210 [Mucilaginibacter sp.]|jgi:hypothetical protein